jgi:UDP-galactopyranose mutase
MEVVVIGAGFAGASVARLLHEARGARITVLEQTDVPGGMLRTHYTEDGLPYEYGPRIVSVFRGTTDILPFLAGLLKLQERRVYQGTRLRPEYPVIPFPIDRASLRKLPCGPQIEREWAAIARAEQLSEQRDLREYLETSVGPTLTELAFEGFNRKFWGRRLEEMPADWGRLRRLERIAERGDYRLPSVAPHYYPVGGFNSLFDQLLAPFNVRYGTTVVRVEADRRGATAVTTDGEFSADLVITTAPIDALLDHRFGPLEWRGYRVETERIEGPDRGSLGTAPDGVPFAWLYTPWPETPVCRTTDFGVIHHGHDADALDRPAILLREIIDDSVPMYPVWWQDEIFSRYLAAVAELGPVIPLGRLGLYKYTTMDSTLAMAQRLVRLLDRYLEGPPPDRVKILREVRGDWGN